MRCLGLRVPLMAAIWLVFSHCPAHAYHLELDGARLEFSMPGNVRAYDSLPVKCKLTGNGDAVVHAVTTDSPMTEQYFDTAIPHKVGFRIDYLSEEGGSATYRITNTGDTIWRAAGYGGTWLTPPISFAHDIVPGESLTNTCPVSVLKPKDGLEADRAFSLTGGRVDTAPGNNGRTQVDCVIRNCKPGDTGSAEVVPEQMCRYDSYDELGQAFARVKLDGGKSVAVRLRVQVPIGADRLVVRLIKDGKMKAFTVPLKVSEDSLRLDGKPNRRWTLDGKAIFVACDDTAVEKIPEFRKKYGGDNVVLVSGPLINPNPEWVEAVRKNGFKVLPTIAYVRLQMVAGWTGTTMMEGAPEQCQIHRVDALEPKFPKAMAEVVHKTYENLKDVLYRTTDGKAAMWLSNEQSYGYPWWASHLPTRWGGSSEADRAAFRIYLREKYGSVGKLNKKWKTAYKDFEGIDPLPICLMYPPEYPDPWKEWGPALEDFDRFRSKIHGEFWVKTVAEVKKLHPDLLCGMNLFGGYASETEPVYTGFFNWGIKDYRGKGVNWLARRTGCLPDDMMCFDFFVCWNSSSAEGARKNVEFWRKRGKEVVTCARGYSKVVLGGNEELKTHSPLGLNLKGIMVRSHNSSFYTLLKSTYESGGIAGLLVDPAIGSVPTALQSLELQRFNQEVARAAERER